MAQNRAQKKLNVEHYVPALEGFAIDNDVDLQVFGDAGIHWRLSGGCVLDCWPTTGRFWIKELPLIRSTSHVIERKGKLPWDYMELDKFLRRLFL